MQKFRIYVEPDPQHCFFLQIQLNHPCSTSYGGIRPIFFFLDRIIEFCLFQRHLPAVAVCRLLAQDGQIPAGHPPLKEPLSIFQT